MYLENTQANYILIFLLISKEPKNYAVSYSTKSGHLPGHCSIGIYGRYQCHLGEGTLDLVFFIFDSIKHIL